MGSVSGEDMFITPGIRSPLLDVTRALGVFAVCVLEGDRAFGTYNINWGQCWAFQLIATVAGVSFALSRKSLCGYILRVSAYVMVGSLLNLIGMCVAGTAVETLDGNLLDSINGIIYHMFFAVFVGIYSVMLAPSKRQLRQMATENRQFDSIEWKYKYVGAACALILLLAALEVMFQVCADQLTQLTIDFASVIPIGKYGNDLGRLFTGISSCVRCICILLLWPCSFGLFLPASYMAYAVLLNSYCRVALFRNAAIDHMFNLWDWFLLGFTVQLVGLRHRKSIGIYARRYWFVIFFACGLLQDRGPISILEFNPPEDFSQRIRYATIQHEMIS